jgi:RimJ/RimL family protein N-acetyltransferase
MTWPMAGGAIVAIEPREDEIVRHAPALMAAYNDPHNAPLLGHTELLDEATVIESYLELFEAGGYSFLVFCDGELVADGDLRHVREGAAEMAFLVTAVARQGLGLGTRVATMLHAFGFARLGLGRIYASVIPENVASRRVFEKLGHTIDDSPAGRAYADEPGDLVTVVERSAFERVCAPQIGEIEIALRGP